MTSNPRIAGSVKNKVTATEILEERKKLDFDQKELFNIYWDRSDNLTRRAKFIKDVEEDPKLANTHKFYEMTR